jgi:hypothetical protein
VKREIYERFRWCRCKMNWSGEGKMALWEYVRLNRLASIIVKMSNISNISMWTTHQCFRNHSESKGKRILGGYIISLCYCRPNLAGPLRDSEKDGTETRGIGNNDVRPHFFPTTKKSDYYFCKRAKQHSLITTRARVWERQTTIVMDFFLLLIIVPEHYYYFYYERLRLLWK